MTTSFLTRLVRLLRGEKTGAATIVRKQNTITRVAARESQGIENAVNAELATTRALVGAALNRIDDLVGTGVLQGDTSRNVAKLRAFLGSAQGAL